MNCPKCGEVCGCPVGPGLIPGEAVNPGSAWADTAAESPVKMEETAWREELSARLSRYRSRRKAPPPRYPSLRLPFDSTGRSAGATAAPLPGFESVSHQALALNGARQEASATAEPQFHPQPELFVEAERSPAKETTHATAKVIEFPRFAWAPPSPPPDQLAEPVCDRPRILEVPELEPLPPALGGIIIEPPGAEQPEKRLGIDVPLQSAPMGRRFLAALIDGLVIAAASALFGFIFWKIAAIRLPGVQLLGLAAGIPALFWMTYNYLLIVYGGSTPGLRLAKLNLTNFDGTLTSRSLRRWRVLACCLSAVSLGMGYAWVFLDEDALCWHDRITHTCLAPQKR